MGRFALIAKYVFLLWITAYFCYGTKSEDTKDRDKREWLDRHTDNISRRLELLDFCQSANLIVLSYPDITANTVKVLFELSDPKFKDCFTYYDIFLEEERKTVNEAKILYVYNRKTKAFYRFENVTCGIYEIVIQPCYNDWQCAPMRIRYPKLINMSSSDCNNYLSASLTKKFIANEVFMKEIQMFIAFSCVVAIIIVIGMAYYYYTTVRPEIINEEESTLDKSFDRNSCIEVMREGNRIVVKKIHVYIFHYYDKNDKIKRKVEIFKDFLEKSSVYASIKVVECELPQIFQNPNDWLREALEEESEDGSIIKIIIIDSKEENEVEEYETENSIYTQLIKTLDNDKVRSIEGYDNLFVARLSGVQAYSKKIVNFVRGSRYHIPNHYHLINLCCNLCSGSGLDISEVEKKLEELYFKHEIRNIGLTEHV